MSLTALRFAATGDVVSGAGWTTPENMAGKTAATYARWDSSTSGATAAIEGRGYDAQSLLPPGATVTQVRAQIRYATNTTTSLSSVVARFYNGTTALGTSTTLTRTANALTTETIVLNNPTSAQLADLRVRITGSRPLSTTASILYVDRVGVEIDFTGGTWPAAAAGSYSVWGEVPSAPAPPPTSSTSSGFTLGTQFELTGTGKVLRGIRFWRPADATITTSLIVAGLFRVSDAAELVRIAIGDLSGDPVGGWVTRALPVPLVLAPGEQYVACAHFPAGSPIAGYTWPTVRTDGPVQAGGGPNGCYKTSTDLMFPDVFSIEQAYWVDPVVGDSPEHGRFLLAA